MATDAVMMLDAATLPGATNVHVSLGMKEVDFIAMVRL